MAKRTKKAKSKLAILGGPKAVTLPPGDIFRWPIITREDEEAALKVLRAGAMSGTNVTKQFEKEYARWHRMKYALAFNTGTASLHTAMWACGIRRGDEVIAPAMTYWATCLPVLNLGGTVVFADVHPDTLCIDPGDIEHRITKRTKAIIPVHYAGHPADMDPILKIAKRHRLKVIEDVSHAHGGLYKGRLVGTMGDVGCFSVMSGKSLAIGEGGIFVTNNREIFERGLAFAHYSRHDELTIPRLVKNKALPLGGFKYRMHQISSAVGRVQLKYYRRRMKEIQRAMNYFWDCLEGCPGLKAHRPPKGSKSTMGGWYAARGLYRGEEIGGLPIERFCAAVNAEGASTAAGANFALNTHPLFNTIDVYGDKRPTNLAFNPRKIKQGPGTMPVAEAIPKTVFHIPWFKHYRPRLIEQHAKAFRKVCENADLLM